MQKTYWWRILLIGLSLGVLVVSYVGFCDYKLGKCLGGNSIPIIRTLFHFSLALFVISLFLLFVKDNIFIKWFRFAIVWVLISMIVILATPENRYSFFSMDPEREEVSIWMGSLFVILSFGKIVWGSRMQKKNS